LPGHVFSLLLLFSAVPVVSQPGKPMSSNTASLEVKIIGYLPGSKFEEKLTSDTKTVQRVADLNK
jgi:hypothetical protein